MLGPCEQTEEVGKVSAPAGYPLNPKWDLEVEFRYEAKKALKLLAICHVLDGCVLCKGKAENCQLVAQAEEQCLAAGCTSIEIASVWHYTQDRARPISGGVQ